MESRESVTIGRQVTITGLISISTQLTTFAILGASPFFLSQSGYAQLMVLVASTMLSCTFFELGLNTASTKFYGEKTEERWLINAASLRLYIFVVSVIVSTILAIWQNSPEIAISLIAGAALTNWNGVRVADQALQDYTSFWKAGLIFALLRSVLGISALFFFRDPIAVIIGTYILPSLAALASRHVRIAFRSRVDIADLIKMSSYAVPIYINGLAFNTALYLPQFFLASNFDEKAVGTYGLIVNYLAPISLVIGAVRAVLLPRFLSKTGSGEDKLWSRRGFLLITIMFIATTAIGVAVGEILHLIYGETLLDIRSAFPLFALGFSFMSLYGIYSLSVHTLGLTKFSMYLSVVKLVALFGILHLFADSFLKVIGITSLIIASTEGLQALYLAKKRNGLVK